MESLEPVRRPRARAVLLFAILAVFCGLRLWNINAFCLDGDEAFSYLASAQDMRGLLDTAAKDISHPPLFYILLKGWMAVGTSVLWLRLLPVLISFLGIVPFLLLCRDRRIPPFATYLALLFWATNGVLIDYAQHLRNFSLLQALSLWSIWFLSRYADGPGSRGRALAGLFVTNLIAVYTHYWGWVLVAAEFLVLLVGRRRLGPFILASVVLLACFAPWAVSIAHVVKNKGTATAQIQWMGKPSLGDLVWLESTVNGALTVPRTTLLGVALFGAPILLWCVAALRGRAGEGAARPAHLVPLLILAAFPAIFTFVASVLLPQSVWAPRQLLMGFVPHYLLVAIGVARLERRPARVALTVVLGLWSAVAGAVAVTSTNRELPWDRLFDQLAARQTSEGGEGEVVVYADEGFFRPQAELYLTRKHGARFRHVIVKSFEEVKGDRFWVVYRTVSWKRSLPPQEALARMGYRCGAETTIEEATGSPVGWLSGGTPPPARVHAFPVYAWR